MRELPVFAIRDAVRRLFLDINRKIGPDVEAAMRSALEKEISPAARYALTQLVDNYAAAEETGLPLCQDTGMAICFLTVGQDVHFTGGDLNEAVQQGVREAYEEGYFRKSIVSDPLFERKNTGDNCPAVLHLSMEPGESVRLMGIAKGFGSENMSRIFMLPPAAGEEGVLNAIVTAVREAGPNPCPPIVVGVGIVGDFETAPLLAKRATARPLGIHHPDPRYAALEETALDRINRTGIGAAGIGGLTTALWVSAEYAPTHIAGMPVAVCICCHASRHGEIVI